MRNFTCSFFTIFLSLSGVTLDKRDFGAAVTGIVKNIKDAGRGEVDHTKTMPEDVQTSIHKLLGNLIATMEFRKDGDEIAYKESLKNLPSEFRNSYHILLLWGAQYIITTFDLRRGREGIQELTKGHFKLVVDKNGEKRFDKVHCIFQFDCALKIF